MSSQREGDCRLVHMLHPACNEIFSGVIMLQLTCSLNGTALKHSLFLSVSANYVIRNDITIYNINQTERKVFFSVLMKGKV